MVFSRYTNEVRFFQLSGSCYEEQSLDAANPRLWIPELGIGLGLWQGDYDGITRSWLRWYDAEDNWIPTPAERAAAAEEHIQAAAQREQAATQQAEAAAQREQAATQQAEAAAQRAEQAVAQLQQVVRNLLQRGMSIEQVAQLVGLPEAEVRRRAAD